MPTNDETTKPFSVGDLVALKERPKQTLGKVGTIYDDGAIAIVSKNGRVRPLVFHPKELVLAKKW